MYSRFSISAVQNTLPLLALNFYTPLLCLNGGGVFDRDPPPIRSPCDVISSRETVSFASVELWRLVWAVMPSSGEDDLVG